MGYPISTLGLVTHFVKSKLFTKSIADLQRILSEINSLPVTSKQPLWPFCAPSDCLVKMFSVTGYFVHLGRCLNISIKNLAAYVTTEHHRFS